ncbi:MAG TPA: hypothetical protein DCQ06_06785, partial [Myxococcales bacterium]|nr:hypothetical protein [Myxococcales bacterium]
MRVGSCAHRRQRYALLASSFAVVMVLCVTSPVEARAARYIQRAQKCAQELDSSCVIRLLGSRQPKPANAAAHWRLLAGALSRVAEHPRARAAFVAWLKLSPNHQIEKASVPKLVWQDYQAAWLSVRSEKLDLRPRVQRRAYVPEKTTNILPVLPPPPRSARDNARDTILALQSSAAVQSTHLMVGGELSVGLQIKPSIQMAMVGFGAVAARGPATLLAGIGVSARWHPIRSGVHRLGLLAEVGGA